MTQLVNHYGGWKPSRPDRRDQVADTSGIKVLPEVDPRKDMMAPYDQGQLGSCTANAVAAAVEWDSYVTVGKDLGTPSRLDIYYGERKLEGELGQGDTGAFGRDGFKFAHTTGVIPEKDWPYDIAKYQDAPPADQGQRHKIGAYKTVPRSETAFKAALSNHQTIAIGFTVYESFEGSEVAKTGIVPMPTKGEQTVGGHEVLIVGYLKDEPLYGLARNSWAESWGIGGYFLMPWKYLMTAALASDFRTIVRPLAG